MYTLNYDKRNTLVEYWYGEQEIKTDITIWELFNENTPYFG